MNVAVTGVGGLIGQNIIKAIQKSPYEIVGIDGDVLGTGLYATKKSYLGLYANQEKFIDKIIDICKKENCKIIFPGLDVELEHFSNNWERLVEEDIIPVISSPDVISVANNKIETYKFLKNNGFPAPETFLLNDYSFELDYPLVLKPNLDGSGSIGKYVIHDINEFEHRVETLEQNNYVVQEYVGGDEYTCGVVSFDKSFFAAILMKRQLKDGNTYKAFVVKDDKLLLFLSDLINVLNPFGPINVQLRFVNNKPYVIEFNARCSGTTANRALAGFNEPKMVCDFLNGKAPSYNIREVAIFRYWKELVVDYNKIEDMQYNGFVYNDETLL